MLYLTALLPLLALFGGATAKPIEKRYTGVYIVSGRNGQCLHSIPRNGNGAPITTQDCSFASTVKWDISPGSGSVTVSGTSYALDAGSSPGNNGAVKIWQSYPGLYQQTWYLTDDNRIAITGGDQCLDQGENGPQTYRCTPLNTNQIWYILPQPLPPASSSIAPPPASSSAVPPPVPSSTPPPTVPSSTNRLIHPRGDTFYCLSVMGGSAENGREVAITGCFDPKSDPYVKYQTWDVPYKFAGPIRLSGTNWCLDAGSNPASGTKMKIWECYPNLPQQTWTVGGDNKISLSVANQCIDTVEGQGSLGVRPYTLVQPVQTWQCFAGNPNQVFTISA